MLVLLPGISQERARVPGPGAGKTSARVSPRQLASARVSPPLPLARAKLERAQAHALRNSRRIGGFGADNLGGGGKGGKGEGERGRAGARAPARAEVMP